MDSNKFFIPNPCNEDWYSMNPKEQGRYRNSCDKVVTDFTQMSKEEIVIYLKTNQKVCGTFKKSQLPNSLNINIPISTMQENSHNVYRLFFIALLISMGSTLFSCKNDQHTLGKVQLIEKNDTLETKSINSKTQFDTIAKDNSLNSSKHCSAKSRAEIIAERMKEEDFITGEVMPNFNSNKGQSKPEIDPMVNEKLNQSDTLTWD